VGVFLSSFALPALEGWDSPFYGWQAFCALGETVLIRPEFSPFLKYAHLLLVWFANPLFCAGALLAVRGRDGWSAACGLLALLGALSCGVDLDRSVYDLSDYRVGYYAWAAGMALLTTRGTVIVWNRCRRSL
jgi:hypothetical protein